MDEEAEEDGANLEARDKVQPLQMDTWRDAGDQSGVSNKVDSSDDTAAPDVTEAAAAAAAGLHSTSDGANTQVLPRSLSVPAVTHTDEYAEVASCQRKVGIRVCFLL